MSLTLNIIYFLHQLFYDSLICVFLVHNLDDVETDMIKNESCYFYENMNALKSLLLKAVARFCIFPFLGLVVLSFFLQWDINNSLQLQPLGIFRN